MDETHGENMCQKLVLLELGYNEAVDIFSTTSLGYVGQSEFY